MTRIESGLAVTEVVIPNADELLIESQFLDSIQACVEPVSPFVQGARVTLSRIVKPVHLKTASLDYWACSGSWVS